MQHQSLQHLPNQLSIQNTQPPAIQYTKQPVTNYKTERHRQTESSTIYHIPQEYNLLSHFFQNRLQQYPLFS